MSIYEMVGIDVVDQEENIQIDLPLQSIDRFEKMWDFLYVIEGFPWNTHNSQWYQDSGIQCRKCLVSDSLHSHTDKMATLIMGELWIGCLG